MILDLDAQTLASVRNPALAEYARIYVDIYEQYLAQVSALGLEFDDQDDRQEAAARIARLGQQGAILRNDAKSVYCNGISPACEACQKAQGSATFFISLRCHRDCFYCFNPNQENYSYYTQHQRDAAAELAEAARKKQKVNHLALTGGEPLLHKPEALAFFRTAQEKFPEAYTRLYTSGDYADELTLQELKEAGLDEIRFSIRMHDLEKGRHFTLDRIALAKKYLPRVMVEMPVLPGTQAEMQEILLELNELEVFSLNLLEFCFPYANADQFRKRGYRLKKRPYRVLYDYWYAGGLPVAGSELECLHLLEFAIERGLKLGVHYCSLENKHTGQLYQMNAGKPLPKTLTFSPRDYFLKSAKVFGEDVSSVLKFFKRTDYRDYTLNPDYNFIEFNLRKIHSLRNMDIEVGISTQVFETRQGEQVLRELKLDLTRPQEFDLEKDL